MVVSYSVLACDDVVSAVNSFEKEANIFGVVDTGWFCSVKKMMNTSPYNKLMRNTTLK